MPIDVIFLGVVGLALFILSALSQLAFWQRKEYRWDRFYTTIFNKSETPLSNPLLILFSTALGVGWLAAMGGVGLLGSAAGWVALIIITAYHAGRVWRQGIHRPQITGRLTLITVVFLVLCFAAVYLGFYPIEFLALQLATLLFFIPALVTVSMLLSAIPTAVRKKQIMREAQRLRARQSNLHVVGITGSYGKTSTKHFLYQLLEGSSLQAAATQEHRNSEYMVAVDMLEQLPARPDVYIAEMGAYRRGEIAKAAQIAKPTIAIITAIDNQHIALFGSIQNIASAKFELVHALPKDGVAVLNYDNAVIREQAKTISRRTVWFSSQEKTDIWAEHVRVEPREILCTLHIGSEEQQVRIPVVSRGMLVSVLAAVAGAHALSVSAGHIFAQLEKLVVLEQTMKVVDGKNGATVIDDSYSASEAAVHNAVSHLAIFPQPTKVVIMVPIIELGEMGPAVHERIGRVLAESRAKVWIYSTAYQEDIRKGMGSASLAEWFTDPKQLARRVQEAAQADTAILLEGRIPEVVRQTCFPDRRLVDR